MRDATLISRRGVLSKLPLSLGGIAGLGASGNAFAVAAAGELDTGFASAGKYVSAWGGSSTFGPGINLLADGSLVVAGKNTAASVDQFAAFRLSASGRLDTGFGSSGLVQLSFGSGANDAMQGENVKVVAVQFDGKVLLGGEGNNGGYGQHGVVRLRSDGSLDTSFGGSGKVLVDFGRPSHVHDIKQQADTKLLVIGDYYSGEVGTLSLTRLHLDGSVDTSFANAGKLFKSFGGTTNGHCVTPLADGRIVVSGYAQDTTSGLKYAAFVMRLTAAGKVDTSFGTAGSTLVQAGAITARNYFHAQLVQPDGKIVLVGGSVKNDVGDIALIRFSADGALDSSFGSAGIVLTDLGSTPGSSSEEGAAAALQGDGKILVAGYSEGRFVVARYTTAGVLDASFGSGGKTFVTLGTGGDDFAKSMLVQPDGKIAVAGFSKSDGRFTMAVVRLLNDTIGAPLPSSDAERLFRWAELKYAAYFPPGAVTTEISGYVVRYYSSTANYLGISNGSVYVLGASFGALRNVGLLSEYLVLAARDGY